MGVRVTGRPRIDWDLLADRILTSRHLGFPIMLLGLAAIFYLTISGANVPSALLGYGLFWIEGQLETAMEVIGSPWWLTGFLVSGVYRGLAWVIGVMLPPMAIPPPTSSPDSKISDTCRASRSIWIGCSVGAAGTASRLLRWVWGWAVMRPVLSLAASSTHRANG